MKRLFLPVTRIVANKYEYNLDIPGEVIDLVENWLMATVELDSIFIYSAVVEQRDSTDAYIMYEVTTILKDRPEGPGFVACKRFSEFDMLHKLVKSSFSVKLNRSKEIALPPQPKKTWMKKFDDASVESRRAELETYLQELIKIPAMGSNPDVLRFLNVPMGRKVDEEQRLAAVTAMVEACSTADTDEPPKRTAAGLARLAMSAEDQMAKHVCEAIGGRLNEEEMSVKLKTLNLLSMLLTRGSSSFCMAAMECCEPIVERCCSFDRLDPEHGAKPAELIRTNAAKILATLRAVAAAAARNTEIQLMRVSSVEVAAAATTTAAYTLSPELVGHMQAATADTEEPAPLAIFHEITLLFMEGNTTPAAQLQAVAEWLGRRLRADATAIKLKTLILLGKLMAVAEGEGARLLVVHCKTAAAGCLQWNKADAKYGDRPAALVRESALAVLATLQAVKLDQ